MSLAVALILVLYIRDIDRADGQIHVSSVLHAGSSMIEHTFPFEQVYDLWEIRLSILLTASAFLRLHKQ